MVGCRVGPSFDQAAHDGFRVISIEEASAASDLIAILLPDEVAPDVYSKSIEPFLGANSLLIFAHGFCMTYGLIQRHRAGLVSPVGPGTAVREKFLSGDGLPAFWDCLEPEDSDRVLSYAKAIGCPAHLLIKTTFRAETECDLFGEQVVLCGGMPELAKAAFELLVAQGYQPEMAYLECVSQIRLLAELIEKYGIAGMKSRISDTAEYGSYQAGSQVIGSESRAAMRSILARIQSGEFAKDWILEANAGKENLNKMRQEARESKIEEVFRSFDSE